MPKVFNTRLKLQNYLPYRLSVAANAVSRLIARAYEDRFGITVAQWRLIAVLAEEGALTPQSVCGRIIMDKVTVMRAARDLLERRLVKRLPNSSDGRSHRLELTREGRELFADVAPLALHYESHLLLGMKKSDVHRLNVWLQHLEHAASGLRGTDA